MYLSDEGPSVICGARLSVNGRKVEPIRQNGRNSRGKDVNLNTVRRQFAHMCATGIVSSPQRTQWWKKFKIFPQTLCVV